MNPLKPASDETVANFVQPAGSTGRMPPALTANR